MDGYADEAEYLICMRVSDMPQPRNPKSVETPCCRCHRTCWRSPESNSGRMGALPTLCSHCGLDMVVPGDVIVPFEAWRSNNGRLT